MADEQPVISIPATTRLVQVVEFDVSGVPPVQSYHSQPMQVDKVTITYEWPHWESLTSFRASVHFDGYLFTKTGKVGTRRTTDCPAYDEVNRPWLVELIEAHRPEVPAELVVDRG